MFDNRDDIYPPGTLTREQAHALGERVQAANEQVFNLMVRLKLEPSRETALALLTLAASIASEKGELIPGATFPEIAAWAERRARADSAG